jgi:hypothetical protein
LQTGNKYNICKSPQSNKKKGKNNMFKKGRIAAIIVIALLASITTYAFAATNTVPASNAGDGSASISGYTIGSVVYTLSNDSITSVSFTASPISGGSAATKASIQLISGGSWFTCNLASGTFTCAVTGVTALAASTLRVVAVQ